VGSGGREWAEKAHAAHVASTTVESDVEALKLLIAKFQERVTQAIQDDDAWAIEAWAPRLARHHAELAADLRKRSDQES
jgi:hypothetical protein